MKRKISSSGITKTINLQLAALFISGTVLIGCGESKKKSSDEETVDTAANTEETVAATSPNQLSEKEKDEVLLNWLRNSIKESSLIEKRYIQAFYASLATAAACNKYNLEPLVIIDNSNLGTKKVFESFGFKNFLQGFSYKYAVQNFFVSFFDI